MHPSTNPNPNPNPNPLPQNTTQHIPPQLTQQVAPPLQYLPIPQDTFMNMSASIPEPMKPFDGLDHSYTPEEYLQQVEARLTFAIGEEPQNNPIKNKSWHNRRMAYIQCSLTGTALDWYTNLHISYKQQWNSFVQLFKKQFSSQKTAYYAQVEAMSLMKKDNETVRHFALRVQQLVKKGWCNENAATINLKNNEIFTKGLPKKLKDFTILINITIHSIITFLLHQIQILIQISTKITLNLIRIQQHTTLSYNYHKPVLHRIIYILKIKELRILQLLILIPHNLLKEDFKTPLLTHIPTDPFVSNASKYKY